MILLGDEATEEDVIAYRKLLGIDGSIPSQFGRYVSNLARGRLRCLDSFARTGSVDRTKAAADLAVADGNDHLHDGPAGAAAWCRGRALTAAHGFGTRLSDRGLGSGGDAGLFFPGWSSSSCSPFRPTWRLSPAIMPDFRPTSIIFGCRRSRSTLFWCRSSPAFSNLRLSRRARRSSWRPRSSEARRDGASTGAICCDRRWRRRSPRWATLRRPLSATPLSLKSSSICQGSAWTLVDAVRNRDYPLVQGIVFLSGLLVVGLTFMADLVNGWLDPRAKIR